MKNKHLLVKSITLLYHESLVTGHKEKSSGLVRNVLSDIKLGDSTLGIDHDREQLENLRNTALSMCEDPLDHEYDQPELLQRLMLDCGEDALTYEALKEGIILELSEEARLKTCINNRRSIHKYFREKKVDEIMKKYNTIWHFQRETIQDTAKFLQEMQAELEPYQMDIVTSDPAVVGSINFDDDEGMDQAFEDVQALDDGGMVLKTGWHALNRMLRGGFRRGEQTVIGALQHKFKTGFTLSIFRQIAMYNEPNMLDSNKKPLMLRISFEDNLPNNLQFLYAAVVENATKAPLDKRIQVSAKEMGQTVKSAMMANGYHIEMMRVDPSQWGYQNICNEILNYEAKGYEVHVLMLDYLSMVQTWGCDESNGSAAKRDLFRRMRNFTSPRSIALITPHQLSTEAKNLIREGTNSFVQDIAEKGYYADCKQIDQEVDLEIYIHIECVNNKYYLTVQRGKHRLSGVVEPKDKYFVLVFQSTDWSSGILDDINGPDSSLRRPGGGVVGSGEETPFWETNMEAAY